MRPEARAKARKQLYSGIGLILITAAIGSIMGVFARELATSLNVVQQVFLRTALAALILLIICRKQIDLAKFPEAPRGDLILAGGRGISFYVLAISLGTIAFVTGNYGAVAIVLALPMTAIISTLILREKANITEGLWVGLAFLGAAVTIYAGHGGVFGLDWSLVCAFLSSIFVSIGIIGQKRQTDYLNTFEITFFMLAVAAVVMAGVAIVDVLWSGGLPKVSAYILGIGALAGLANVGFLLASNSGVPRVPGVLVNNVLAAQPLFAILVGFLLYGEVPALMQWMGGIMILASIVLIAFARAETS